MRFWPFLALGLLQTATALCFVETFAEKATDPITPLIQLQFEDDFSPWNHGTSDVANLVQVKTVFPVKGKRFPMDQLIRFKFLVPTLPKSKKTHSGTGFGDVQFFDLFVTQEPAWGRWGFGPVLILPTGSPRDAGQGKWQLGPAVATSFLRIPRLQLGVLAQNPISVAGKHHRSRQNSLFVQPFLIRHFDGWYLSSDAEWVFDWVHHTQQIPVNIGFGGVFGIGKQKLNGTIKAQVMVHENAVHSQGFVPKFTLVGYLSLLFGE